MSIAEKLYRSFHAWWSTSTGQLFWYALTACVVWLFFYVLFRSRFRHRRIAPRDPVRGQIRREIAHSLRSIAIFGIMASLLVHAAYAGWTRLYIDFAKYGWVWFVLSIFAMIAIHDTYFYWTHRLMHHRRLFRFFHRTHHLSTSPTPWAAYAFSPAEAFVQAGIAPVILFTLPVHPAAFGIFMLWQISFNVFGHCGYEIFPQRFFRSPLGLVLNSITHHSLHHEKFQANYGLYFNVWDRLMGTNHASYGERFEQVTGQGVAQQTSLAQAQDFTNCELQELST